jgi:hypothetical protein
VSKRWGTEYESWEFDGGHGDYWARMLRGDDVRPSRVDVAWDFECSPEELSCDVAAIIAPHAERRHIKCGVSGEGRYLTRYVGSSSSSLRARIYRKDQQSPELVRMGVVDALMRLELVMRDDHANRFWAAWVVDHDRAFDGAAGLFERLTGLVVQASRVELPAFVEPEAAAPADELFRFVAQYGAVIDSWREQGISVEQAAAHYTGAKASGRLTEWRAKQRAERVAAAGVEEVWRAFLAMCGRRPGIPAAV